MRTVSLLAATGALAFVGLCGWVLWDSRAQTRARAVAASENVAALVEQDVGRVFATFDLSLLGVVEGLKRPGLWNMDPDLRNALLFDSAAKAEYLNSILVLDAAGKVILSSDPSVGLGQDLGDRDYFKIHIDHPGVGLFVGKPIVSSAGHGWVLPISRRIDRDDGGFGGVVRGSVSLDYFNVLLANLHLGPRGTAAIFKADGITIARVPFRMHLIGRNSATRIALFRNFPASRAGQFLSESRMDGAERLYSFRQIKNQPLVVLVGAATADVFADWRMHAGLLVCIMLALVTSGATLGLLLGRELARRRKAEESLAATAAKLSVYAYQDGLTGLVNRRGFDQRLDEEMRRVRRSGGTLTVLLIDVDRFKLFNDALGHLAGDEALQRTAQAVSAALPGAGDFAARFGGEELAVILPGRPLEWALAVAERIRRAVEELGIAHPQACSGRLTVSIGLAELDGADRTAADFLMRADAALYRAKSQGRNRVEASVPGQMAA